VRNPDASTIHAHTELVAFIFGGEYAEEAVRQKLIRLGLIKEEVVGQLKNGCSTTSCPFKLELSDELPSLVMDV
jgi:hypothetical protein